LKPQVWSSAQSENSALEKTISSRLIILLHSSVSASFVANSVSRSQHTDYCVHQVCT